METLNLLLNELRSTYSTIRNIDFKNLTLRDAITLIGLLYTSGKALYGLWELYVAFKEYGVSRIVSPNLVKQYGPWAGQTAKLLIKSNFGLFLFLIIKL